MDESGKLVVKEIETEKLKVGTPEKPNGITLFDPQGNPYCVQIELGGVVVSTAGECGTTPASSNSETNTETSTATTTTETATPLETASSSTATSTEP